MCVLPLSDSTAQSEAQRIASILVGYYESDDSSYCFYPGGIVQIVGTPVGSHHGGIVYMSGLMCGSVLQVSIQQTSSLTSSRMAAIPAGGSLVATTDYYRSQLPVCLSVPPPPPCQGCCLSAIVRFLSGRLITTEDHRRCVLMTCCLASAVKSDIISPMSL